MSERKTDGQTPFKPKTTPLVTQKQARAKHGYGLWVWLSLSGVAILSATVGAFLAAFFVSKPLMQRELSPDEAAVFNGESISSNTVQIPELTRPVNILVLGMSVLPSDLGKSASEIRNIGYEGQMHSVEGQSDTMLLLRFDPETQKTIILSIPRDTRVVLGKHGIQKINDANVLGGPALAAQEVSKLLLGVGIDRYARINVLGFGKLVDALGGIDFYVPKDMKYIDESQHLYINLKQGKQHLNGQQAMELTRFRHDLYGDLGRMQRQQLFIHALMEQALKPTTIAKIPKLLEVIKSDIDTNLSVEEILALAGFAEQTDHNHTLGLIVPGDFNGNGQHETSYWLPDRRRIEAMMTKYFDLGYASRFLVDYARLRVSIQDGTHNIKAVQSLVKKLQKAGYQNVSIDASLPGSLAVTQIVAQQGDADSASNVYLALGFGELRVETSGTLYSDVTIKLGRDSLERLNLYNKAITY